MGEKRDAGMTSLKRIRKLKGMSQKELSVCSEVSLRMICLYEQRQRDINRAAAITLYRIAKVPACSMEDLLELEEDVHGT